jgi:hypothetical protein
MDKNVVGAVSWTGNKVIGPRLKGDNTAVSRDSRLISIRYGLLSGRVHRNTYCHTSGGLGNGVIARSKGGDSDEKRNEPEKL